MDKTEPYAVSQVQWWTHIEPTDRNDSMQHKLSTKRSRNNVVQPKLTEPAHTRLLMYVHRTCCICPRNLAPSPPLSHELGRTARLKKAEKRKKRKKKEGSHVHSTQELMSRVHQKSLSKRLATSRRATREPGTGQPRGQSWERYMVARPHLIKHTSEMGN